jgi:hypothetical protein
MFFDIEKGLPEAIMIPPRFPLQTGHLTNCVATIARTPILNGIKTKRGGKLLSPPGYWLTSMAERMKPPKKIM